MEQNQQGWKVVSTYSRAQALEDGILIDISHLAYRQRFTIETAITSELFKELGTETAIEELLGRFYLLARINKDNRLVALPDVLGEPAWMLIGADDNCEPVLTLMRPGEY